MFKKIVDAVTGKTSEQLETRAQLQDETGALLDTAQQARERGDMATHKRALDAVTRLQEQTAPGNWRDRL